MVKSYMAKEKEKKKKKACYVDNSKGRPRQKLRQKLGEKTMGMAKIPKGMSWEKITWQKKKKRKIKNKGMR